jgi:hypothetical protein
VLGAAILLAWLLAPLGIFWPLARLGFTYSLGSLLPWKLIIYPHDWIVFRSQYSSDRTFFRRYGLHRGDHAMGAGYLSVCL